MLKILTKKNRESTYLKYLDDWKTVIEYLNGMDDIYKDNEECNPNEKCKILITFVDMIA